jgi:hypothetical protein
MTPDVMRDNNPALTTQCQAFLKVFFAFLCAIALGLEFQP